MAAAEANGWVGPTFREYGGAARRRLRIYRHKVVVAFWSWLLLFWLLSYMQKLGLWEIQQPEGPSLLSFHAAISLLALLFPLSAIIFVLFNVVARREQVEDAANRADLPIIYFPESGSSDGDFAQLLASRFRESCNGLELALLALIAGAVAFVSLYFFLENMAPAAAPPTLLRAPGIDLQMIMAGFFGAYAGALVTILRRYRTLDIYPSTYMQATIAMLLGIMIGTFLRTVFGTWALSIVFAISFVTAGNVNLLGGFLRGWLAKQTGFVVPEPIEGDLQKVIKNSEAIESLHNMSIYSLAELITAEPLLVYLNLPQSISVINGWIDEALLQDHFETDFALLEAQSVRRFTELLSGVVKWPATRDKLMSLSDIQMNDSFAVTSDKDANERIRLRMNNVLRSGIHHRLLAILSREYRETFFGSSKTNQSNPQRVTTLPSQQPLQESSMAVSNNNAEHSEEHRI